MENPLRKPWAPYALLAIAVAAVVAVFAVVALKDDTGIDPEVKGNLREEIEESVRTQFAALLQVSESEAEQLFRDKELEEAGEDVDVTENDILRTGQAAAQVVLDQAVEDGDISERQAESTEELVLDTLKRRM